jgi:hypothetical protein
LSSIIQVIYRDSPGLCQDEVNTAALEQTNVMGICTEFVVFSDYVNEQLLLKT